MRLASLPGRDFRITDMHGDLVTSSAFRSSGPAAYAFGESLARAGSACSQACTHFSLEHHRQTMKWLQTVAGVGQKTWNLARSIGPFLISQSDKASEAWQRHQGRLAEVDVLREAVKGEVETGNAVKRILLEKYITASPEERVGIERDIEFVEGKVRHLRIVERAATLGAHLAASALQDVPDQPSDSGEAQRPSGGPQPRPAVKEIEGHWLDKFQELSRKQNEPWREELLARALASEAEKPGSVSPRAIWLIGNLERQLFSALSQLLDLCVWDYHGRSPFLPNVNDMWTLRGEAADDEQSLPLREIVYKLGDIGVLADHLTSQKQVFKGGGIVVQYADAAYLVQANEKLEIRGVLFTPLGVSMARFYEPRWNRTGRVHFGAWIESIKPNVNLIPLPPSSLPQWR